MYQFPAWAADTDSLWLKNSMNLPDKVFFDRIYSNPALAHFRPDAFAHGNISAHYNYSDTKKLGFIQEGTSTNQYKIAANGFTIHNNKIFWGSASYNNFHRKNVRWNNIYDFKRIGPYLLADSIGGNSQGEEYTLSGGLSVKYKKWEFGAEAGYIAGQSYRKTDPRPQATSTDLYLQISSSYNIIKNYQAGLSFNAGKYRENIKTSVEQDNANYDFFPFKGFGLFDLSVFKAQSSSYSATYEGENYGGSLFFAPQNKNGFLGNIKFNYSFFEPNYGSDNSPNLYIYRTYNTSLDLGWQKYTEKSRSFIKFSYDYNLNKGTERIYYTMSSESTPEQPTPIVTYYLLSSNWFYTKKIIESKLSGGHEWFSPKSVKWVTAEIGYRTYEERYLYPQYKMHFEHITSSIELGGEFHIKGASSFVPKVRVSYSPLQSSKKVLPEDSEIFDLSVKPNIAYLEADLLGINGSFTYQYKLKKTGNLYASVYANYLTDNGDNRHNVGFSVGVKY